MGVRVERLLLLPVIYTASIFQVWNSRVSFVQKVRYVIARPSLENYAYLENVKPSTLLCPRRSQNCRTVRFLSFTPPVGF